ncbi:hypothetical protein VF21_03132 [Pseudogymnoascus sp. 05NY08]|nr:hypothetical protein VF21_03132 [Pseudogymnoascus sp. 05NY08]
MATSQSNHQDEAQPPYPSYEEIRSDLSLVQPTVDGTQRLIWPLNGPLTSLSIMKERGNWDSPEPYFRQTSNKHPMALVPSILYRRCHFPSPRFRQSPYLSGTLTFGRMIGSRNMNNTPRQVEGGEGEPSARYGRLPYLGLEDEEREEEEEGDEDYDPNVQLLMCCGEIRPHGKDVKLVVKPATGGEGFVTVHDYVSALHPWLMNMKEDIVKAKGVLGQHVPPVTELLVDCAPLENVVIN